MNAVLFRTVETPKFSWLFQWCRGWRLQVSLLLFCLLGAQMPTVFLWLTASLFIFLGILSKFRWRKSLSAPPAFPAARRLQCYGPEHQLAPIRNLHMEFFEPFVVECGPFDQPGRRWSGGFPWNILALLVMLGSCIALDMAGQNFFATMAIVICGHMLLQWTVHLAFPINFRVVPGYLDVLTSTPFSASPRLEQRIPLAEAEILGRLDQGRIEIRTADDVFEEIQLNGWPQATAAEFVRYVLLAAISPHGTPELPQESLLG